MTQVKVALPDNLEMGYVQQVANDTYEWDILQLARPMLTEDDVVIEAGGGFGYVAAAIAPICRTVWSVEAHDVYFWHLLETSKLHANIHAVHGALTISKKKEVTFNIARLFQSSSLTLVYSEVSKPITPTKVPAINVDRLVKRTGANVLILDLEGYESPLLDNMDLRPLRALIVEWHPYEADRSASEQVLTDAGFVLTQMSTLFSDTPSALYEKIDGE